MKRLPTSFAPTLLGLSNFDFTVDDGVESELRKKPLWAGYPARDFYGYVWFEEEGFYCEVWQYNSYQTTMGPFQNLNGLMVGVSEKFGFE